MHAVSKGDVFTFGGFVLEPAQRRLARSEGTEVDLPPRHLAALCLFVERAGQLLEKDELLSALWPGAVVEENNLSQLVASLRRMLGDDARDSRFIQTVPRRGFRFVAPVSHVNGAGAAPRASPRLAVLPFKPLTGAARDEVLELGMADNLIAHLSTLAGLTVLSIGSVRRFAGPDQDPLRAARVLGADWVVDGSLQRQGDELRASARLLYAPDGTAAWSCRVTTPVDRVFDAQDRIAEQVAQALAPRLHGSVMAGRHGAEPGGTRSVAAYRCFLRASTQMLLQRADELRDSIALFNRALDADPGYARAWVGLADAYRRLSFVGGMEPALAFAEVEVALRRALALAPTLAEAHATLGIKLATFDFDWTCSEQTLRRALALNPNLPLAQFALGQSLLVLRGDAAGLQHLCRARELDPLQPLFGALEASFLRVSGRRDEAARRLALVLEAAPSMPLVHLVRGQALLEDGHVAQGLQVLRQAVAVAGGASVFDALLGHYLAVHGHRDEAGAILGSLLEQARGAYVAPTSLALVYVGLGDATRALDALDRAWASRDARLAFIRDQPYWRPLRGEPRFQALLGRLDLDAGLTGFWNP